MKKNKKPSKKSHAQWKFPSFHPSVHVLAAIVLFAVSMQLSRGADMTPWEESVFLWIYDWPAVLLPFFFIFTQLGSIHMLGMLLIYFLIKQKHNIVIRLLLTSMMAYLLSGFAKDIWGRLRPNELLEGIVNLDYVVRGPGFPSGHTALAVALALTLGHYMPRKYLIVVPIWIIGVGLSRIYLGIHAPLDIIGGFAIGWLSYALFRHVRLLRVKYGKRSAKTA